MLLLCTDNKISPVSILQLIPLQLLRGADFYRLPEPQTHSTTAVHRRDL